MDTVRRLCFLIWCSLVFLKFCETKHFFGATISWEPVPGKPNTAKFDFKAGWLLKSLGGNSPGCTAATKGQHKTSIEKWKCLAGCGAPPPDITDLSYFCTTITDQFEHGENSFTHTFRQLTARVGTNGAAWRELNYVNGVKKKDSSLGWTIATDVDLRSRSDIGRPNSSPVALSRPVYRLQFGCKHSVRLLLADPDDDKIKCRWARSKEECGGICNGIPGTVIDPDTCTLKLDVNTAAGFEAGGWYAVAITVEDFPRKDMTLAGGVKKTTSDRLSSIPIQFLVHAFQSNDPCDKMPKIIDPTPVDGARISVPPGSNFQLRVYANGTQAGKHNIKEFTLLGPRGMTNTAAATDTDYSRPHAAFSQINWTPTKEQENSDHLVCFSADDAGGKTSATRCVVLAVGDVDDCASGPCQNCATCRDLRNDYRCQCMPGYRGKNCEVDVNECAPIPCHNGATCIDGVNNYTCVCAPGFTGPDCNSDIDDCDPNPCHAGGTCSDGVNSFTCRCPIGIKGPHCEQLDNPCASNPCSNGSTCVLEQDELSYICLCPAGYTGDQCKTDINECKPNPCFNGGNCTDFVNAFSCSCPTGTTGARCDTILDPCTSNQCTTNGTNGLCPRGFTGRNCSLVVTTPTLSPTTTQTTKPRPSRTSCTDVNNQCLGLAGLGICTLKVDFMRQNCAATCKLCSNFVSSTTPTATTVCSEKDASPMCPRMASERKCSKPDIEKYCRKSCLC